MEFAEPNIFKEKFANYPGMLPISTSKRENTKNIAGTYSTPPSSFCFLLLPSLFVVVICSFVLFGNNN